MYKLTDQQQNKQVEVNETTEGIRLTLTHKSLDKPYFDGLLNDMLTFSQGRPWTNERPSLQNAVVKADEQVIDITGQVAALTFTLRLSFNEEGLLALDASWKNDTADTIQDAAIGFELELPEMTEENVTIPHMVYNNNPSADPNRKVPRLGVGPEKGFICEEHRLPIPCVNAEWADEGQQKYFSFFTIPSYVELADGSVHYGSIGAYRKDRLSIASMSGVLLFNGEKDICYVSKSAISPYEGGYLDMVPGFAWNKQFALDWGTVQQQGWGFRKVVEKGYDLFKPEGAKPMSVDDIVYYKKAAMDDRFKSDGHYAGYVKFNDTNEFGKVKKNEPFHFLYGWTGQCLRLAWCDAKASFMQGEQERLENSTKAVNFYVDNSGLDMKGLRNSTYDLDNNKWGTFDKDRVPIVSSRAYGETMTDLADIILLYREHGQEVPETWVTALTEAIDFFATATLPSGIFPFGWELDGKPISDMICAAGIPCAIATIKAYRVTGNEQYLQLAEQWMNRYYELHAKTFDRPFAHSTLDAACEDKEAGMYYFIAVYELYMETKKDEYKEMSEVAADWLLTFVFFWAPAYDKGDNFDKTNFSAVGWPGVSVQNHHLDVFFPTFEMWNFGRLTKQPMYEHMTDATIHAMGQTISTKPGEWQFTVLGEQGEAQFQTNWQDRGNSNKWNPSWIIAWVLYQALRIKEGQETSA